VQQGAVVRAPSDYQTPAVPAYAPPAKPLMPGTPSVGTPVQGKTGLLL
jgi:hypothetical protein